MRIDIWFRFDIFDSLMEGVGMMSGEIKEWTDGWKLTCPNGHEVSIKQLMDHNADISCLCWRVWCDECNEEVGYECITDEIYRKGSITIPPEGYQE